MINFPKKISLQAEPLIDVLIFGDCATEEIKKIIDKRFSVKIFEIQPFTIYLNKKVLYNYFALLTKNDFSESKNHKGGLVFGFVKQLFLLYIKACIKQFEPKAVITFYDNDSRFCWLASKSKKIKFISIQNGLRLSYQDKTACTDYYAQHLFCFGTHERETLPTRGYKVKNFYPCGSLCETIYERKNTNSTKNEIFDILVISCWRGNIHYDKDVQDSMDAMQKMDLALSKIIRKLKLKTAIITRFSGHSNHAFMNEVGMTEVAYFKQKYGELATIFENELPKYRNIYQLISVSSLIISSFASTATLEAFGRGKKILYCNFNNTEKYHADFADEIKFSRQKNGISNFSTKIMELLEISNDEYLAKNKSLMNYYMTNYDSQKREKFMMDKINEIINESSI